MRDETVFSLTVPGYGVERWTPSVCGLCSIGCGVEIGSSANDVVAIRGRNTPVGFGRLGPKGMKQFFAHGHPRRARHPMMSTASGDMGRCTGDAAMSAITSQVTETPVRSGPDALD